MGDFPNPMLVCTCHQSVFDPAQGGKVLDGPAPRPPWTFDFIIEKGRIVIKDLEPGGEKWG
jgi:Rieske Fe-S protein